MKGLQTFFLYLSIVTLGQAESEEEAAACKDEGHPASFRYDACLRTNRIESLDREMTFLFEQRLAQCDKNDLVEAKRLLIAAQKLWQKYREETCSFEDSAISQAQAIAGFHCRERMARERLTYLKDPDIFFNIENGK